MENSNFERIEGEDGKEKFRINKIPLEDLLSILEGLYEAGTNFIDLEIFADPEDIQSVITINTRPEYMATEEELAAEKLEDDELEDDDDEEEDDILDIIKRRQQEDINPISDDELEELM